MLKSLSIENIAVIEKADIEFCEGLNVLTGETGAGKSIVVDSINAILGERTSKELVRHNSDYAFVNALFTDVNDTVKDKLSQFDIDCEEDDTLLLSRKISSQGKSTCRINGTPCTVSMLKEIGSILVNIHGQHDSQALLNPDYHINFVDMLSDDDAVYHKYKSAFRELVSVRKELKLLTADEDTKDRQLELLNFQINEIQSADIKIGEWQQLKERKNLILNAQNIINALNACNQAINGTDENMGAQMLINSSAKELMSICNIDNQIKSAYDKLIELNDGIESVKDIISSKLASIDFNPNEIDEIEERLNMLYQFSNKYGETEQDMLNYLENAIKKRDLIDNSNERMEELNHQYDLYFEKTVELANQLSNHRKQIASNFETAVKQQLEFLDMPKIQFIVNFEKGNLSSNGFDKVEFLISTNPGEPPKPLAKIASGGELSRIMLAIKNIIATHDTVDTLIFDEIDTGVSGRASRKIGLKLHRLAQSTQVICVTHSAQIASVAHNHLLIQKEFVDNKTYTAVNKLDFEQRKYELARIMGGLEITDNLLQSAQDLLEELN